MKTQTKTIKANTLKEYASNQATIRQVVELTDLEYKKTIYNKGLAFLDFTYPPKEEEYTEIRTQVERDPFFWKWWRAEFSNWEQDLINFCKQNETSLSKWFKEEVDQFIGDRYIESSYQTMYLKRARNIRI